MQYTHRPRLWMSFLSIVWFWLLGCSTTINRQGEQVSIEQFDSLRSTYYSLNDSLNYAWTTLKQSDDQKLAYLDQLLQEVSKSDLVSRDTLDTLQQMVEELRQITFDSVTMANAQQIRQYDSLTVLVSDSLITLTDRYPDDGEHPRVMYLTDKIISENSSVMLYRLRYDHFSRDFNRFIEENKELMSTLDSTGRPVFKRPMFKLVNEPEDVEAPK
ncbi:MAG: hypothetical protein RIG62_02830 [Cyclobacteriaceae bacterium]